MPEVAPSAAQVRTALEELLGWQGISRSPQLSELLRYVVEKTLTGDEGSIKAYSIAVDVFGRPQSFDPQADPIVRVQARRLRTLLEQFYDTGKSASPVQIRLPLGRYVPEFSYGTGTAAEKDETAAAVPDLDAPPARPVLRVQRGFLLNVVLGLGFTVIGVAIAVAILRWVIPPTTPAGPLVPDFPLVSVGTFDNLTGESVLDDDVAAIGTRLVGDLGRFETLRVAATGGQFAIRGTLQESNGQFSLKALLSQNGSDGIVWSTTLLAPRGVTDTEALKAVSLALAAQLGAGSGPLHAPGRFWLTQQKVPPKPTAYVCTLEYMAWRDVRKPDAAATAADCLKRVLSASPDDAVALAEDAGLLAWQRWHESKPGDDLVALLADQATEVGRAVSIMPESSFAYEQQGLVLGRQGSIDAATGALKKAVELNPASMDAVSVYGLVQWLNGDFENGRKTAELAIAAVPSPAPYYYITRAFDALRQRRFYDAIDAAQALAAGDEELGPAIALAAAPIIGRTDIIDRFRPMMLANVHFQAGGILPRLEQTYREPYLIDRLREGLILAGIPTAALDGPFNADGTTPASRSPE